MLNFNILFKYYKIELLVIFLGISHQILQKFLGIKLELWDNYGDDLIAVPFVSSVVLLIENHLFYKDHTRTHNFIQLSFIFLSLSILFELILPYKNDIYKSDFFDVVFYLIGFIIYYKIRKFNKR